MFIHYFHWLTVCVRLGARARAQCQKKIFSSGIRTIIVQGAGKEDHQRLDHDDQASRGIEVQSASSRAGPE